MIFQENSILAVIDPTRVDQWSLRKALAIGKNLDDPKIFAYLCAHSNSKCDDAETLRAVEVQRHKLWLNEILADSSEAGIPIEPIVDWNADWREGVCIVAERMQAGIVIKRASGRPGSLGNSDRRLIRKLKGSALFLVKQDPATDLKKVLIAINPNATDSDHLALNETIVALAKRIRGNIENLQLHSISAFDKSEEFKHPPDIARSLDISRAQAHVVRGSASQVIPESANNLHAGLVIVGNVGRHGLSGVALGNTAEKILADIESDVLVVVKGVQIKASAA